MKLISAALCSLLLCTSGLLGRSRIQDNLDFAVQVLPDLDGNVTLDNRFTYNYTKNFLFGGQFYQVRRSEVEEKGRIRSIAAIKEEVIAATPLGYDWTVTRSRSFMWRLIPSLSFQRLSQERKLNLTNTGDDTFKNENANLTSYQFGIDGKTSIRVSSLFYLNVVGTVSPFNALTEIGSGYDTSLISTQDDDGNIIYSGGSGDYAYKTDSSLTYYDVKVELLFPRLVLDSDLVIGYKKYNISYNYASVRREVYAADIREEVSVFEQARDDNHFFIGFELDFLSMGLAKPFILLSYTQSVYQNLDQEDVTDQIFGFGLEIRKL